MTVLTGPTVTATQANPQSFARFVSLYFSGFTARMWTGVGPFTLGGNVYTGFGSLGSLTPISDRSDLTAQRIQLQITGLESTLMSQLVDYTQQGAQIQIFEAQLDLNGAVVGAAYLIFGGQIDTMSAQLGETMTITIQAENYISFIFRGPDGHRETAADQEALFSGDHGFSFAASVIPAIPWGANSDVTITSSAGGFASADTSVPAYPS